MPADRIDAEMAEYCGSFTVSPVVLRVTNVSNALPTALTRGFYDVKADVDCFILQGGASLSVVTTNAAPLFAGEKEHMPVRATGDTNVAGVCPNGVAGYVYLTRRPPL